MDIFNKETKLQKEAQLINRWNWICEDIEDYDLKLNTSIILENSYGKMVQEGQLSPGWLESTILNEDNLSEAPVTTAAVGTNLIPKVMFPVIRRVMPELIANKIVSVQPLTQPTGVIYYILYQYSNTKAGIAANDQFTGNANQGSPAYAVFYSSEKLGPYTATIGIDGADTTINTNAEVFLGPSGFSLKRAEVYPAGGGAAVAAVLDTVTANNNWVLASANVHYNSQTGEVTFRDSLLTTSWAAGDNLVFYVVYNQEGSNLIPEMEFSIASDTVSTTERKIKIRWTKESEQDMQAYHKIDVESELVKIASLQMNYEVDREILTFINDQVITALSASHDWTSDAPSAGNNTSGNFLDRHRSLAQKMHQLSAKVAQYNRISPCTWAVVSPQIASVLQMLPDFKGEISSGGNTIYEAGMLGGKLDVYVDPNKAGASADEILMGFKSENSTYGAGVVYAPYTSWMSNTVTNVDNFDSVRGFFNRYALTKVVRGEYNYARLTVNNLMIV